MVLQFSVIVFFRGPSFSGPANSAPPPRFSTLSPFLLLHYRYCFYLYFFQTYGE